MQNKSPIVFLHGWNGSANSWGQNINYFEKLGHKVFALKMPGFDLPNPEPTWGVPEYAKYVREEIIKTFPNQKVILVGHSFGGRVSIFFASHYSNLISSLVLTSSAGINLEPSILRKSLLMVSKTVKTLEKNPLLSNLIFSIRKILRYAIGTKDYKNSDETKKQIFKNVVNLDLKNKLADIYIPTLILWGEQDKITPISIAKVLNAGIKDSKLVIIKNAEHAVHQTHNNEWNHHLKDFITHQSL